MAKRTANTDLNHDNWQVEDEPEDAGTFTKAPDDIIEKRVIKVAKRRLASGEGTTRSAFGSFTGFKTTTPVTTSSSPFSFLANVNTTSNSSIKSSTSVNQNPASNGAPKTSDTAGAMKEKSPSKTVPSNAPVSKSDITEEKDGKIFKKSSEYFAKLKGLNEGVAQWIKTHVDSNPFCILTPIFQDYERYLKEIDSKHGDPKETIVKSTENASTSNRPQINESTMVKKSENSPFGSKNTSSLSSEKSIFGGVTNTKSIFGNTEQKTDSKTDFGKSVFNSTEGKIENKNIFGSISSEKNPFLSKPSTTADGKQEETKTSPSSFAQSSINTATFSFGQSSTVTTPSAGFSFGSGKPFSFGAQAVKPSDAEEKTDSEDKDDDEEPPKPEFKSVTEEGAIYEQRCKVFIKKDGNFTDRGVGILFLKPTPTSKTQLIVRADTSLGNLLLNTLLTESIPTKRMNKNTVMIMCLPMPDSQPPPTAVLLRVKTSEDADVLIETLNKHKK